MASGCEAVVRPAREADHLRLGTMPDSSITRDGTRFIDPATRVMDRLGERWTFLILREAFFGVRRFNQMQRDLGVSKTILAERLRMLVELQVLRRHRYRRNPDFYEYRLTERGLALYPAILALSSWSDRYLTTDGPSPLVLRHRACGDLAEPRVVCSSCGEDIDARDIDLEIRPAETE